MEYLQYIEKDIKECKNSFSFKPYYKWNTFNTKNRDKEIFPITPSFKPYYKWNTFNT